VKYEIEDYLAWDAWVTEKVRIGVAAADDGEFASAAEVARVREKFAQREQGGADRSEMFKG
jgi:predicted transcriptional regulator